MNDADRRAIELVALDLSFCDDDYRKLGDCSELGQAALLLAMDDVALEAWYERAPAPRAPISRVLARAVDRDDIAERLDATLADDPGVLADLRRAQIVWAHPALPQLLDRDEFRASAAWMLAQTDVGELLEWLDGDRAARELVEVARAVAPTGASELFDGLAPWLGAIRDDDAEAAAQLESALFLLSPDRWGRGFLRGQWEAEFLHDSVGMADILAGAGQSYWSASLAHFEPGSDEFGAIARMIAAGAAAILHFAADDPPPAIVNAFYVEDWSVLGSHPAFAIAGVLAEEDSWQQPLLESAAHDLLLARGLETPGIGGLPLSSSHPDADEIAAALEIAKQSDVDPIALVVTMCDVQELRAITEFRGLPAEFARFEGHPNLAVAAAAKALAAPPSIEAEQMLAHEETVRGFAAAERLARIANLAALRALVDLLADGPVLRAGLFAALLHQELRTLPLELMEK